MSWAWEKQLQYYGGLLCPDQNVNLVNGLEFN